jgi:hypothetical protein
MAPPGTGPPRIDFPAREIGARRATGSFEQQVMSGPSSETAWQKTISRYRKFLPAMNTRKESHQNYQLVVIRGGKTRSVASL